MALRFAAAAALVLLSIGTASAAIIMDAPGDLRVDPASISSSPRTYKKKDVLVRFDVLGPRLATVTLPDLPLQGHVLRGETWTDLRKSTFLQSSFHWEGFFSSTTWRAAPIVPDADIYCSKSLRTLGPFDGAPSKWGAFAARICLVDNSASGKFDAIFVVGKNESRVVGPIAMDSYPYEVRDGENQEHETIEFYIDGLGKYGLTVGFNNYKNGKKYYPMSVFFEDPKGYTVNYVNNFNGYNIRFCSIFLRKDREIHVVRFARSTFEFSNIDPKLKSMDVKALDVPASLPALIADRTDWAPASGSIGCRIEE